MTPGWAFDAAAAALSDVDAATRTLKARMAGSRHAASAMSKVAGGPGAIVSFRKPDVTVNGESLLLRGVAAVTLLDMDGRTVGRELARLALTVPVTRGTAAAADVDGVRKASIRLTFGQVDSVVLVYSCRVTADIVHFPETATLTTGGPRRRKAARAGD